jgi:hypothetical protein
MATTRPAPQRLLSPLACLALVMWLYSSGHTETIALTKLIYIMFYKLSTIKRYPAEFKERVVKLAIEVEQPIAAGWHRVLAGSR